MQLASRFGFSIHKDTVIRCRDMVEEAASLPVERIFGEWEKWALQSNFPSLGLKTLFEIGWHVIFPGLDRLLFDEKSRLRIFSHVERAGRQATAIRMDRTDKMALLFAALCRDMEEDEPIRCMQAVGLSPRVSQRVSTLVREARAYDHTGFSRNEDILKSADRLGGDSIAFLASLLLSTCDTTESVRELTMKARALNVLDSPPKALLLGRDLVALGILPGPAMGRLLKDAFEAQLSMLFTTKEEALGWAASKIKNI
jgi:tRNA nucleotidyltransferase (CCA-adding enzyme)